MKIELKNKEEIIRVIDLPETSDYSLVIEKLLLDSVINGSNRNFKLASSEDVVNKISDELCKNYVGLLQRGCMLVCKMVNDIMLEFTITKDCNKIVIEIQ